MENHNVTVSQHSPDHPAHRRLTRAAAATGLLIALAVPALAGTAYAEAPGAKTERAAPAAAEPSASPSAPAKRTGQPRPTTGTSKSPAPRAPSGGTQVKQPAASASPGTDGEPSSAPSAPAPPDQKELAHTGSSTANTAMGLGAGALILAGGGTVYAVRRRHQH
ncbi:LPXTG cell wall anchor domain-containing protein [Streptomyces sp. NPDC094438]|uniref:LPXTG cell wall anchor domain-containing protein n=1 Tax=Streptomyces sp. NPDC094438 TaxID=3366061 RepID=UPI0038108B5B